jgi:hypothetical protein
MGLAITVGMLESVAGDDEGVAYFRRAFERLRVALDAAGASGYREPERVSVTMRPHVSSFPYSYIHYLRRIYARMVAELPITPVSDEDGLDDDRTIVEDEAAMLDSHLLCHSDCEGYYVPLPLADPLFLDDEAGVSGGGMVGSSQGLLDELRRIAPCLGITLAADGSLSEHEAARLYEIEDDQDFHRELTVWLTLHEACLASIASGAAIVFH